MSEPSTTTIPSTPQRIKSALAAFLCVVVLLISPAVPLEAADDYRSVAVADPYLEMHTGPGRGYPVFHVVDRGETVEVIKQRTGWFLVRAASGKEGWVDREQMGLTLQRDGEQFSFRRATIEDFTNARWETGILAGDFGGANSVSVYGSYSLNPNVSVELWGTQILGNISNGWMAGGNIVHEAFPEWRVSPFFTMGAGFIRTKPKSTIVLPEDRNDQIGHVGAGFRIYVTRRFLLRAEYKSYVVFTSRDENEEIEEWKAGFAFFF
jgi:hypothetical protein